MRSLSWVLCIAALAAATGHQPGLRGLTQHVMSSSGHDIVALGDAFMSTTDAEFPRLAESKAQSATAALAGFGAYELSVVADTAAVGGAGLSGASNLVQGYFNALDDTGATDAIVGKVEDTISEALNGKPTPLSRKLDEFEKKDVQDISTAKHLACAIHMSYFSSDVEFFVNSLVTGFGVFMKIAKALVQGAWALGKAMWAAMKAFPDKIKGLKNLGTQGKDKLANIGKFFSPLFGGHDDPEKSKSFTESAKSMGQKLKDGLKVVKDKVVDAVKSKGFWRTIMVIVDLIYHVAIETVFPKELRDRIGMAATVISRLLPGKLTKAQARCMACLLVAPPEMQLPLVKKAEPHGHLCHMKVGKDAGPFKALYESADEEGKVEIEGAGDALQAWFNQQASKADSKKEAVYMGAKLALSKVNSFLNAPFSTTFDMVAFKEKREAAFGDLEVSPERREMATGYYAGAGWETHVKFLEKFKHEATNMPKLIKYERNTDAHKYAVHKVADHKAMVKEIEHSLKVANEALIKEKMNAKIKSMFSNNVAKADLAAIDNLKEQEDENKAKEPTLGAVSQAIKSGQ